jgi:hypothetical protein
LINNKLGENLNRSFFRRRFLFPKGFVQKGVTYYLVDWDLHISGSGHEIAPESSRRNQRFHRELLKLLNVKKLKEYTSSASVLPVETYEEAVNVAKLVAKHGGEANVREAKTIETFKPETDDEWPNARKIQK